MELFALALALALLWLFLSWVCSLIRNLIEGKASQLAKIKIDANGGFAVVNETCILARLGHLVIPPFITAVNNRGLV